MRAPNSNPVGVPKTGPLRAPNGSTVGVAQRGAIEASVPISSSPRSHVPNVTSAASRMSSAPSVNYNRSRGGGGFKNKNNKKKNRNMMAAKIAGAGLGLGLKMMLGGDFGDFGGGDCDFSGGYDFGGGGGGYQPSSADWFAINNAPQY